mmetsp:Transcript_9466/g.14630  ORF Transcript_9466/g.14630 Transcript_9466/m.14630 type:complete len:255 (+) Transcript_9466:87-851(+)
MPTSAGKPGCPCINATSILASLTNRHCKLSDGQATGIQLKPGGSCVPFSYGSNQCRQHDLLYDPSCALDELAQLQHGNSSSTASSVPTYCIRSWRYVDMQTCKKESDERVFRSSYFGFKASDVTELDVFYSYSTCKSTADDWFNVEDQILDSGVFNGIDLQVAVPIYLKPMLYKRDSNGEILTKFGDEYYDDNIPYEGVYIDYLKKIMEISNGDIRSMTFTHRSRASSILSPLSGGKAAIHDIEDGLVDMVSVS